MSHVKQKLDDIELGKTYKDRITGWEGVAMSRTEYLYGCVRVELEAMKDGKPEGFYFDIQRLDDVDHKPSVADPPEERTGGSRPSTPRTGLSR